MNDHEEFSFQTIVYTTGKKPNITLIVRTSASRFSHTTYLEGYKSKKAAKKAAFKTVEDNIEALKERIEDVTGTTVSERSH